jgi:hypothetical protein
MLVAGSVAAGALALSARDPHDAGSWGRCPLLQLTGVYCPFCGGLRAVNDLTSLDLEAAAASNLLLVALLPLTVLMWGRWARSAWREISLNGSPHARRLVGAGLVVLVAAFTIARNTSAGGWLAP